MNNFIIMLFILLAVLLLILFIVIFKKDKCKTITPIGKSPFCGCSSKGTVNDIKFDGTSPVTGFFYRLKSPDAEEGPNFPGTDVIDLYRGDDRFGEDTRSVTSNMTFWMDQKGVSRWVNRGELYTKMINKCYPDKNPVTELIGTENNRHEWTIELPVEKINEAIAAMYEGTFKYGLTFYEGDDVDEWKCCA